MIEIRYERKQHKVTLKGHAGAGVPGQDLICCAASIITYTLAANVRRMQKRGWIKRSVIHLAPGDAEISCTPHKGSGQMVQDRMDTVCMGFLLLARDYPEFVSCCVK